MQIAAGARCLLAWVIRNLTNLVTKRSFNKAMSQLFQTTMKESNPKLAPELFDHNSASEAAIEILNMSLVNKLSGN